MDSASDEELEIMERHMGNGAAAGQQPAPAGQSGGQAAATAAAAGAAPAPAAAAPAAAATTAERAAEAALMAGEVTSDAALLQLQVNDLLAEVRPKPLKPALLAGVLQQLRGALATAKPREVPGTLLAGLISDLGLSPEEVSLSFEPPAAVEAVGSFTLQCAPATGTGRPVVDVAVVMPPGCLHKKDHLNYRYAARRALYLAALSRHLARHPDLAAAPQRLEAFCGDPARPALLLELAAPAPLCVRLLPVPSPGAFPPHKLAPDRNNVRWVTRQALGKQAGGRPAAAVQQQPSQQQQQQQQQPPQQQQTQQQQKQGEAGEAQPADWLATPRYNAGVLADALMAQQAEALGARLRGSAALRDALLLLRVWAVQAGLAGGGGGGDTCSDSSSGLGGHLLAAVVVAAAERAGPTAAVMSGLQLFRAALKLLADAAAWGKGIALARQGGPQQGQQQQQQGQAPPSLPAFRKAYPAVLVDASGWLNLAAGVPQSLLQQAQLVAGRTLAVLDRPQDPGAAFSAAFLERVRPAALFDYAWAVQLPEPTEGGGGGGGGDGGARPGDTCQARQEEERVEGLVRKALTNRALLVRALPRRLVFGGRDGDGGGGSGAGSSSGGVVAALARGIAAPPPGAQLLVGAVAEPRETLRLVDVGPPADDAPAAARFRALWGDEKAELRRFPDGRIAEAVVWAAPPGARHTIPDAAVTHLLGRHLGPGARVGCTASRLDAALEPGGGGGGGGGEDGAPAPLGAAAAGRAAEAAVAKLGRQLRALGPEVVLKVVGVQPLSAASRRTAPFVPEPHPLAGGPGGLAAAAGAARLARCLEPLEVMVQLEGSGRWPDDPAAYAKMKAAIGCQLAAALEASAGFAASPCEECVDVFVDGFALRLLLYTDRDAAVHAKVAAAGPHTHHHHATAHGPPRVLLLSWHHGLVSSIEGQHAAYGPTCRLLKRWLGCQLMGNHVSGEAAELLAGAAFTGPCLAPPPASRVSGLLRALQLLAGHPWGRAPLLVDPLGEVGADQRRALLQAYEARRAVGTAPAMFIATPRDLHTSRWTLDHPSAGVLQHLVGAAGEAAERLARLQERSGGGYGGEEGGWGQLFATPLADFDAWITLRKEALPFADRALPGAAQRLAKHLARATSGGGGRKRSLGGSSGGEEAEAAPAAKSARAVLRAFPRAVLASQPTAALLPELLVGFDPVARYVAALEERFGHIAAFCADGAGGFPAIGVKWLPAAFVPQPLRPALAHCVVEAGGGRVVPNLPQVLREMHLLGEGLVRDVAAL